MAEVKLFLGDCLEIMQTMPDKSVDFCFTDPPYNVGKDYGTYKDNLPDDKYLEWIGEIIFQIKRIARAACFFVPQKYFLQYWSMLGPGYKQIILSYSPEGAIRYGYVNQFSSLLCDARPTGYVKNVWHNCQMTGLGWFFRENTFGHPGYTSEDVTRRVINAFTRPGETVFDPFSGTGTTLSVCQETERNAIGIELDREWYLLSQRRIKEAQMQPTLFETERMKTE